MRRVRLLAILLVAVLSAPQDSHTEPPMTADAIMARVAANQDRSEALRKQYVYRQHTHILTHKPKGRLLREETADDNVLPTPGWNSERIQTAHRPLLEQGQLRDVPGRA